MSNISIGKAIVSLVPNVSFTMQNDDYSTICFLDETTYVPTLEEIQAEQQRLQQIQDSLEYQRLRAAEYPPITDYIDGVVKGDSAQVQAYIDACLAVKAKYPKGTS